MVVVADYQAEPTEGMQVVSRHLVDGLRTAGRDVSVVSPESLFRAFPLKLLGRPRLWIFTHGPGRGTVIASWALRHVARAKVIWVATRPDLESIPRYLSGRRTAQAVVCNQARADLAACAVGAIVHEQFIGIDPDRLGQRTGANPWPDLVPGVPIGLHVGHVRKNRGLDLLIKAKQSLGHRIQIVVLASPTFEPDPGLIEELEDAGILVRRGYVDNLADLYSSSTFYLFPGRPDEAGAVELPLGVLEAVASGCPVLTTDFGALRSALGGTKGVHFAAPENFVSQLTYLLGKSSLLSVKPAGLPGHLHADRLTESILTISEEVG